MDLIRTDIDLSLVFKASVSDDYRTALEFLTVNPDYSLLKFRDIVSSLCAELASNKETLFDTSKLIDQIDFLYDQKIIDKQLKDNLHKARQLGNAGAHKSINASSHEDQEFLEKRKAALIQKAQEARKLIIAIFEDTYSIIKDGRIAPSIEQALVGVQEYREILFKAATSLCYQEKLKAGVIYQSAAEEIALHAPLVVSSDFSYHHKSLYKLAANHYEASYKISADVDTTHKKLLLSGSSLETDEIINQYCKLEPLFKYSVIASDGYLGEALIASGFNLMKIAADRGYGAAEAEYGSYLYLEKKYESSKYYLDKAAEKDEPLALRFLFYFFSVGDACEIDTQLALEYLNRGIAIGCPDSIGALGEAYHKGVVVAQDNAKAEEFLKKAIEAGSLIAKRYFIIEFNNLAERMADHFQAIGKALLQSIKDDKPKPIKHDRKIGPNEDCPCGSGKKYKKCCRDHSNKDAHEGSYFPRSLP